MIRECLTLTKSSLTHSVRNHIPTVFRSAVQHWSAIKWSRAQWHDALAALPEISVQYSATPTFDVASQEWVTYAAHSTSHANDFFRNNFPATRTEHAYITTGNDSILKKTEQQQQQQHQEEETTSTRGLPYLEFIRTAMGPQNVPQWWQDVHDGASPTTTSTSLPFAQPFFPNDGSALSPFAQAKSLVWLSAGKAVAAPHRDAYHNMSLVLAGTKTFALAPPASYQLFGTDQPRKSARMIRSSTGVYVWKAMHCSETGDIPMTSGFLRDSIMDQLEQRDVCASVTLHPGDCLYLPYDWYHEVRSTPLCEQEDFTAAVNFWQTSLFGSDIFTDAEKQEREKEMAVCALKTFVQQECARQDGLYYD